MNLLDHHLVSNKHKFMAAFYMIVLLLSVSMLQIFMGTTHRKSGSSSAFPYTLVQTCTFTGGGSGQTSDSCTFGSNITAGNMLYFTVMNLYNGDTLGDYIFTWTGDSGAFVSDLPDFVFTSPSPTVRTMAASYCLSAGGGTKTITVTVSRGGGGAQLNFDRIILTEWSHGGHPNLHDASGSIPAAGGTTEPESSNAITTSLNGELLIGYFSASGLIAYTPGTVSATFSSASTTNINMVEYGTQTTGGAGTIARASTPGGVTWGAHIAAFK